MKIKHVYGNVLKLDIPLTIKIRTMESDVPTEREEPFYPDVSKGCTVILGNSYNRKIQYDATVSGNVAHIEDDGVIGIGTYKVTVKCYDEEGNPYRYMVRDIIEICDATIDAGIEAGVEFNVETYTLEGAVFVSYGGEQVQSDWAETDPEEKSFIKNKPDLTQYATKNELREVESEIPTLPDHIVTDEHYVHTDNNYTTEEKTKLAGLENYDDTNVLNLIEQTNQNFANYYTKQQTYSQSEVNQLLETQRQGQYVMVEELPTASVDTMFKIYLVPSSDPQTSNIKDEYITIDNGSEATTRYTWEKIGSTAIDLSAYSTTEEMNAAIASALQGKQDTLVSGTNIKTVNNQSILGSGNITIQGGGSSVQSDWNQADTEADDYIKNKPTIPDVPSWALAPTKPTYTANEVGAIPNAELFYGDGRQDGINYVNKLCDTLWAANKRWDVSVNVTDAGGNAVEPDAYYPNMLFDLNYEGTALVLNLETTATVLIKGGSDITETTSRFFTFSEGAIYVHAHSIYHLPKSVSGRVYKQDGTPGWVTLTFVKMDNPANCYKAEVGSECKYPSALELTIEARDSGNPTIIDEIEWWLKRQGDTPLMSKTKAETLYYPLNVKDYIGATQFKVTGSNNNYVLLGGGGTKALTTFFSGNYNDLTNKPTIPTVPTNVSAFTNDAGFISKTVDDLVNYYLKSETYTKSEVQGLIAAIQQFHYEIYASISAVTSPAGNVLYLIGPTGTGSDKYEEYVYDSTKQEPWVKIGDTSIDLSDYYTKGQTDSAITSALNTALADYTTTAALTLLLAGKQDVINDLSDIRSGASAGATAYQKPVGGIPKTDLAQGVQDSLDKADTALQEDTLYEKVNNNGHEYVDLGLPSGTLWAKCNVGADAETDAGNLYAYGSGSTTYQNEHPAGYSGTENPLDLSVDTARQVMGGSWRMPTKEQIEELISNVTVTKEGTNYILTSNSDNSKYIIVPSIIGSDWQYSQGEWHQYANRGTIFIGSTPIYGLSISRNIVSGFAISVYEMTKYMTASVRGVILPEKTQLKQDLDNKQNTLVSGTNIKTLNGESILGSGNINIDISGKEDKTAIEAPVNATDATLPITTLATEVGKYYRLDVAVDTLAVTLPVMENITTTKTVVIYLTGGTTPAVTISSTAPTGDTAPDVYYQDGFEIEAGNTYEINALFNGVAWIVASAKIVISNS